MPAEPASDTRTPDEGCTSEITLLGHAFVCQRDAGRHRKHYEVIEVTRGPFGDLLNAVVEWSDDRK